jgi:bifunctional UDP-N-acetylglucosamine pyrophosphorylase / glucosamine-1-phosphate N-acetyltransferase
MGMSVVILAAGKGTRMKSAKPKVLHQLAGIPLVGHVIASAKQLQPSSIHVIYGFGGDQVKSAINDDSITWVEQSEQLGTGHAVIQAMPGIPDENDVLILYGDVPLTQASTLQALAQGVEKSGFSLLTVNLEDPSGYGRIVRDKSGSVVKIVEQKDADFATLQITEGNTGMMATRASLLKGWLNQLGNNNAQGEYYLTDVIALAVAEGVNVETFQPSYLEEVLGINDRLQLAQLEREYQVQCANYFMTEGVTLIDPLRVDFRGNVGIGQDTTIDINVILRGNTTIGRGVSIGANTVITDSIIEDGTQIFENCVIEKSHIGAECNIGPFARIRPDTVLAEKVKIGNFVETKKANIAKGSKVNHLSYIGDTQMGEDVNVGAGTITCNYDGANKFQTTIGNKVFIGSDTQLIAPVTVGDGATIGAGSTISKDVPADKLTLSRAKQVSLDGWQRPVKKK